MSRPVAVIGVPSSAGAYAPGQEQAPSALRSAGLVEALHTAGAEVRDHGDREAWRWRPDRANPRAQNVPHVLEIVTDTARRVFDANAAGELTLVLGGDCTVGIGTVAGHVGSGERTGLVYFDTHADLNTPDSVSDGALDWMGLAHMTGQAGAVPELAAIGSRAPLLDPEQVVLFGWGPHQATPFERELIERGAFRRVAVDEVAADPAAAVARAGTLLGQNVQRVLVHFDVDVIDFTDTPLSEHTGRNQGLSFADAIAALHALLELPGVAALTVTEVNPNHVEEGAGTLERLAGELARATARAAVRTERSR